MNRSMRMSSRGDKSFMSQGSQTSERNKDLQKIAQEREEDVAYTLEVHSQILGQEENMKKFILDAYRQRKMEEHLEKTKKPKKMSKETLDRLYKPPTPKKEAPNAQQAQAHAKYDKVFVEKLVRLYGEARPMEKPHVTSERLFAFWQGMSNKVRNFYM